MENRQTNENFIAYARDAQSGKLRDNENLIYCNGKIIAAGSKESMDSLYNTYKKYLTEDNVLSVQVDLNFAKFKLLESLKKLKE